MAKEKSNNHYIPRFLLRAFCGPVPDGKPGKHWLVRYDKDGVVMPRNVASVGQGHNFYGEDNDELENAFEPFESRFAQVLQQVRADHRKATAKGEALSNLAWMLAMRTDNARRAIGNAFSSGMQQMAEAASSTVARHSLRRYARRNFKKRFSEALAAEHPDQAPFIMRDPAFKALLKEAKKQMLPTLTSENMVHMMQSGFDAVSEKISEDAFLSDAHNKSLLSMLNSPDICPAHLRPDAWDVLEDAAGGFVLGDACVFAISRDGKQKPFLSTATEATDVYLPISPTICLVGRRSRASELLNVEEVTRAAVRTSVASFFAPTDQESRRSLIAEIGLSAELLSEADIRTQVPNIWRQLGRD